jgi:hypothetical protein
VTTGSEHYIRKRTAAKNMTREERLAKPRKAAKAAAEKRRAKRLATVGLKQDKQAAKRKRSGRAM